MKTALRADSAEQSSMKYWAFISHSGRDARRWALPLRNRLEAYRVPKVLLGKVVRGEVIPPRLKPVFRDRDELAAGPDLPQKIRAALALSRYLIVVCSPHSKGSAYVGQEIQWFKQLGRADRIIAYIVDGEPAECFREELIYEVDERGELQRDRGTEPLAADARAGRDGKDAVLKVIAGMVGANFDELRRRELQRRQRFLLGIISLTVSVAIVLTGLAGWALVERDRANGQTFIAKQNEKAATNARDNEAKEHARAVQRLVRMLVAEGWRTFGDGDALAAVPWFVQALEADRHDPQVEMVHRLRVAGTLRRCPRLAHVWFENGGAFSPDGRRVVIFGKDTAQVREVDSNQPVGKAMRQAGGFSGSAFSPNGKQVLTWSYASRKSRFWDAATGEPIGAEIPTSAPVERAAFDRDGRFVKLNLGWHGERAPSIAVFDVASGKPARLPGAGEGPWTEVLFAGRAPRALTVSQATAEREARLWDLETGKPVGPSFRTGYESPAQLDDDGEWVLFLTSDGGHQSVQVWDATTGQRVGPLIRHGRNVVQAALSPSGERVVTVSETGMFLEGTRRLKPSAAQVWDVRTGHPVGDPFVQDGDIERAYFTAAGDWLVTVGKLESRLWDISSGQPVTSPLRHRHGLLGVRVSADSRRVLTWGQDGSVRLWDLAVTDLLRALHPEGPIGGARVHYGGERQVEISPDGKRVLVNVLWSAQTWDAHTTQPLTEYIAKDLAIGVSHFSPDGEFVAGGGTINNSTAATFVWNAKTGEIVAGPLQHGKQPEGRGHPGITALSFHPASQWLATASQDGAVRIWDVQANKPFGEPLRHRLPAVISVAFSADGNRLLSVAHSTGDEAEVRLWDMRTGTELPLLPDLSTRVRVAALSRDGQRVVVGAGPEFGPRGDRTNGTAGTVEVRTVPGGALVGQPMPQPASPTVVAFSPDGHRVFAACADGSARVYDADTGTSTTPVLSHPTEVSQAAFSRDGSLVFCSCGTAGYAPTARVGEVRAWDVDTGEMVLPPLQHLLSVRSIALDPEEKTLVAGGEDFIRFWDVSAETLPVEDLQLLARLLSEKEIDALGHSTVLSPKAYRATWERYQERNPPARRVPSPERVLAWNSREAIQAEAASEWRTANRHLAVLLEARPNDEQLHARLGFARYYLEDWVAAAASFGRSLDLGNKDWNVQYHRGLSVAGQKKWNDAIRDYDAILRQVQTEWEPYYQRGRAYQELGRHDRAEADCTEAIAVLGGKRPEFSLNPLLLEQQAHLEMLNGKWQPWFTRGLARQDSGQYKLAAEDYGSVLEANPGHLWSLCNRGTCRRVLGEYDVALKDFDGALKGGLKHWRPSAGRAWIEAHRGLWPQAVADYAEALRQNPGPTDVWYEAAIVRLHLADQAGYKSLCSAMCKAVADRPLGARLKAVEICVLTAGSLDDWSILRRWCEEGMEKKVENISIPMGAVLFRQGRFEQARQQLQGAANGANARSKITAQLFLAMALHQDGQVKGVAEELEKAHRDLITLQAAGLAWTDRLSMELLRREAVELCRLKE